MKKDRESKLSLNRRDLLKSSALSTALGLGGFGLFTQTLLDGIFADALAQSSPGKNPNYIYLQQPGAPQRWVWDLPLACSSGDMSRFVNCKQVGTRYAGSTEYTSTEYATKTLNGIEMPWMWGFDLATTDGAFAPMANLMDGMLIMRGVNPGAVTHEAAMAIHYRPLGAKTTINSLSADASSAPIPAIDFGAGLYQFKSGKNLTHLSVSTDGNLIKNLMTPFRKEDTGDFESKQQSISEEINMGLAALNSMAKQRDPSVQSAIISTEKAMELLKRNLGDVDKVFNDLKSKYQKITKRCFDPSRVLPGINDKPIGTSGTRGVEYQFGTSVIQGDLRNLMHTYTNVDRMCEKFAVLEFIMLNNLSSSVAVKIEPISYLNGGLNQSFDEHTVGAMLTLYINTYFNLAYSSCIYELVSQLKKNGLYENTVIDIGSEFSRNPRDDGSGSDHGAIAASTMLLSGKIKGSHVIGDILSKGGGRQGTWGVQAENDGFGLLNKGHVAVTVASLLGVPSPITALSSLVRQDGSQFIPKLPKGKIKA